MLMFIYILFLLIASHFLCDFALQNDYIAKAKNRYTDAGRFQNVWMIVLTAHGFIHGLPVLLLGLYLFGFNSVIPLIFTLFQVSTHILIDYIKCENDIDYWTDQELHIGVMTIIAIFYGILV